MSDRLVVISPVHSEASHIVKAIAAVLRQARLPDLWVIVDDASTDGTFEIARRATAGADFVHAIRCKPVSISDRDGLAAARDAHAFNVGLAYARTYGEFEYISKLDGDVVLPLDYYELCTKILAEDPTTGIVGGRLVENHGRRPKLIPIPPHHVHGALKVYGKSCFEAIGGIQERLGWDTIDETYARMKGYRTQSLDVLIGEHLRPTGAASGVLRGRARHGVVAHVIHYPGYWVVGRSMKLALEPPRVVSGCAFLYGYANARRAGVDQVPDAEFRHFARRELRLRTRAVVLGVRQRAVAPFRPERIR
jgi:hypothetical protein